jgi:hypothetical protein
VLVPELSAHFGLSISRSTVNVIRSQLRLKYRPPRHNRVVTVIRAPDRVAFCHKMLPLPSLLRHIHFSDESRIVLGESTHGHMHWNGEDNAEASLPSHNFPPSLIVFAVIGNGFRSDLLLVDGTTHAGKHIQNIDRLGFIDAWIGSIDHSTGFSSRMALPVILRGPQWIGWKAASTSRLTRLSDPQKVGEEDQAEHN